MRIAILGPYFWPHGYGIEKVMYAHAKHLSARGHEVHVITSKMQFPDGIDQKLPALESRDSFSIWRLKVLLRTPPPYVSYPSRGGVILAGLQKTLKALQPDVVHAHNIGAPAWALGGAIYARAHGAAFFYSPYYHSGKLKFNGIRRSLINVMNFIPLRTASKIYHPTVSDFGRFPVDYSYAPVSSFAVLPNGVEPSASTRGKRQRESRLNVLFVGRVDDVRKGFAVLEAAVDALPDNLRKRIRLTIVGIVSDATRRRLQSKYDVDAMRVLGAISEAELEQAYADADIFAMPSLYEGFGMPYVEAMRYGIPVIGTTAGGVPEVVPRETGFLAAPGDTPAVAHAIAQLVSNPELRARMGSAGAAWSKRYHWSFLVDRLEADYQRTCNREAIRPPSRSEQIASR